MLDRQSFIAAVPWQPITSKRPQRNRTAGLQRRRSSSLIFGRIRPSPTESRPPLTARGFAAAIDRSEIYAFEEWWKRIEALIASADTVVFVLSPDFVASEVALKEVAFAGIAEQTVRADRVSPRGRQDRAQGAQQVQLYFL